MAFTRTSRHSFVLTRILQAVAAGGLIVAPGCSDEVTEGTERSPHTNGLTANGATSEGQRETTSGQAPSTAPGGTEATSSPHQTTASASTSTSTTETATSDTNATDTNTTDTNATDTNATDTAATEANGTAATETTTTETAATEAVTSPTNVQCELGAPRMEFCLNRERMENQARYGTGQIPRDPPRSDEEIAAGFDDNGCMRQDWVATSCCNPGEAPGIPQDDGSCCYVACEGVCCGRPFVVQGQALHAEVRSTQDWLGAPRDARPAELAPSEAQALSDAWLADALMEHASVASFSRFALDLMALGAPPDLVAGAQHAALDEIEHAQRCFAIASRLAGEPLGPGPLPIDGVNVHSLQDAVRAAIAEGCIGETLAAGIAQEQAALARDEAVRATLLRIAEDELRHAELAWRFVAWAIRAGGEPVRQLVEVTFEQLLARAPVPPAAPNLDPSLMNWWGRLTTAQWEQTASSLVAAVLEPASRALLSAPARASDATLSPFMNPPRDGLASGAPKGHPQRGV